MFVCVCVLKYATVCMRLGQKTTCESWFFLYTMLVPRMELGSLGLGTNAFTL